MVGCNSLYRYPPPAIKKGDQPAQSAALDAEAREWMPTSGCWRKPCGANDPVKPGNGRASMDIPPCENVRLRPLWLTALIANAGGKSPTTHIWPLGPLLAWFEADISRTETGYDRAQPARTSASIRSVPVPPADQKPTTRPCVPPRWTLVQTPSGRQRSLGLHALEANSVSRLSSTLKSVGWTCRRRR